MAYNYNTMMDPYAYQGGPNEVPEETEEERRKRLAGEEVAVATTKTFGDGSREHTVTTQVPGPVAPEPMGQAAQPAQRYMMDPQQAYQNLIQVESGNQDYYPAGHPKAGQPVTSSAGALFAGQVMPATAAQPGFGIKPAASQTPEEYNRVSREYYQAMLNRYGQDPYKAAAAYNAGPGRIDSILEQNNGELPMAALPAETRGYLQKIGLSATPTPGVAEANARFPAAPVAPEMVQTAAPIAPTAPAAPTAPEAMGPSTAALPQDRWANMLLGAQNDEERLAQLRKDPNAPEWLKILAGDQNYALASQNIEKRRAEDRIRSFAETRDTSALAKMLTARNQEGDWGKAILFSLLGAQNSAKEELAKLGVGATWTAGRVGEENVLIKTRADGLPMEGFNATTGEKLTAEQLASAMATKLGKHVTTSAEVYVDTKTGNRYRSGVDERGNATLINIQGGGAFRGNPRDLEVQSIGTTAAKKNIEFENKMRYLTSSWPTKAATQRLKDYSEITKAALENGMPVPSMQDMGINERGELISALPGRAAPTAAPAVPAAAAPVAAAPVAAAPVAAAPVAPTTITPTTAPTAAPAAGPVAPRTPPVWKETNPNETLAQFRQRQKDYEEQSKVEAAGRKEEAVVTAKDIAETKIALPQAQDTADYVLTKVDELVNHPAFPNMVGARIPFTSLVPGSPEAGWAARFQEIKGQQFLQAYKSLKGTGSISEKEGEKAEQAIARMNQSSSEKEFRQAAADFQDIIKRGIDRQRVKAGMEPIYKTQPASQTPGRAGTETRPLSPRDQQLLDWAIAHPDDPRSADIRRRLNR